MPFAHSRLSGKKRRKLSPGFIFRREKSDSRPIRVRNLVQDLKNEDIIVRVCNSMRINKRKHTAYFRRDGVKRERKEKLVIVQSRSRKREHTPDKKDAYRKMRHEKQKRLKLARRKAKKKCRKLSSMKEKDNEAHNLYLSGKRKINRTVHTPD